MVTCETAEWFRMCTAAVEGLSLAPAPGSGGLQLPVTSSTGSCPWPPRAPPLMLYTCLPTGTYNQDTVLLKAGIVCTSNPHRGETEIEGSLGRRWPTNLASTVKFQASEKR